MAGRNQNGFITPTFSGVPARDTIRSGYITPAF